LAGRGPGRLTAPDPPLLAHFGVAAPKSTLDDREGRLRVNFV